MYNQKWVLLILCVYFSNNKLYFIYYQHWVYYKHSRVHYTDIKTSFIRFLTQRTIHDIEYCCQLSFICWLIKIHHSYDSWLIDYYSAGSAAAAARVAKPPVTLPRGHWSREVAKDTTEENRSLSQSGWISAVVDGITGLCCRFYGYCLCSFYVLSMV